MSCPRSAALELGAWCSVAMAVLFDPRGVSRRSNVRQEPRPARRRNHPILRNSRVGNVRQAGRRQISLSVAAAREGRRACSGYCSRADRSCAWNAAWGSLSFAGSSSFSHTLRDQCLDDEIPPSRVGAPHPAVRDHVHRPRVYLRRRASHAGGPGHRSRRLGMGDGDVHAVLLPVRDSHRRAGGSDRPAPRADARGAVVVRVHVADRHGVELLPAPVHEISASAPEKRARFRTPRSSSRGGSRRPSARACPGSC